ncbi:MAG: CdaR family protein [Chloroflexota bacterium]
MSETPLVVTPSDAAPRPRVWRPQLSRRWSRRLRSVAENLGTALLAVLISSSIWIAAVNEQNPPREDVYPGDMPIEVLNKPSALVFFQPFERTARVRIRAPQATWDRLLASPSGSARAFIDLSGAVAGLSEVEVQVKLADPDISIILIEPQSVSVRLEELREKSFTVQMNVSDSPPIGFLVGAPQAIPPTVQVSGAQSRVEQVAEIVATVQLRGAKAQVEREVPVIARDAQGNTVTGVRLTPDLVNARVPVEQRIGFKDVSVKVVTRGTVASGYWLSNISVEPSTLTVVGSPARLDEIGGFIPTETIDVKDAKASFKRALGLVLPQGVSPIGAQTVNVTIDIAPITGGQTVQRQVTVRGLDRGLKATLSPESVDVILGGPLPVLQALKVEDVQVIIDLVNKGPGKYKVTPTVIKPDSLKVESIVPDTIEVVISK